MVLLQFRQHMFHCREIVSIEVPTSVTMKSMIFGFVTLCSSVDSHQHFQGMYHLHLPDQRLTQAWNEQYIPPYHQWALPDSRGLLALISLYKTSEKLPQIWTKLFTISSRFNRYKENNSVQSKFQVIESKSQLKDQECDNVLPGQGYCTLQATVMDE